MSILPNQVLNHTAKACGIHLSTVKSLHKEFKDSDGLLASPEKRYDDGTRVRVVLDDFNMAAICKEVHEFYDRKEYPTLDSLLSVSKGKSLFEGGCTTLWKELRKMGLTFRHV